ncbi:MAG TPA: folylpolyglutamate synthase/dihydrofolate synthase family protein [Terriglobia bacterium]|nr:folylpolyglutamate synthase/dihydrofolate synthase family protein [Terriglobia bacterium]
MNYTQCLQSLNDLGHELHQTKFDLESIQKITRALGNPQSKYSTAIVAGTNGKGSTSAMLAGILTAAGYRTGLYSSPHLVRVNERIRVNGFEIADADFADSFSQVWRTVDGLLAKEELARRPSFFELLTAAAFLHFARAGIDFAVLEVGMGGRLDATNITEPRLAVITNIDLDHQPFLGNTHAAIAWEKAGVIKAGRPVISACENPAAAEVIRKRAAELNAPLIELTYAARVSNIKNLDRHYAFDLAVDGQHFPALLTPLMGSFQIKNTSAAVAAAMRLNHEGFNISRAAVEEGLRTTSWPGRMEVICEHPLVVLDGAHNPAAAREIAAAARALWPRRPLRLVYASMRDKAIGEISEILFPLARDVYVTQPEQERAAAPEEILAATKYRLQRIVIEPNPVRALERACRESSASDVVLVAGSLFLVGSIKRALAEKQLDLESLAGHAVGSPLL